MAVVGSLIVLLGTNNAPLTAGLLAAEGQIKSFGAANASTGRLVAASVAGIGLVAAAGMGLAVRAAADFQEQMAKVNTIAGLTPPALADIGSQVRALSVQTGVGLPDLTSSLYDLLSVGVPIGRAMEFLANATTLSIGGLSTGKEAVDAITTSINAWSGATGAAKLTMDDSRKVTDLWAQGIKVGGFTAADIGSALSNVAAQASTFNTPLEQVVATAALLTTRGFTASTALTSMDAAFTALQRVPPGMEKLQKATHKSYETIARTQGIHEAITQVVADAQKFGIGLVDVFGRTDALGYVINTTGTSARAYEDILKSMYDTSGVAAQQAAERSQTLDRQMQILGASVNDLGITLGTALLPPVTSFITSVNGAVQGVTAWAQANPELSSTILPIIAGIGALAAAALAANAAIGLMSVLASPLVLTFLAVGAAIALVVMNIDAIKRGIQVLSDAINKFMAEHGGGAGSLRLPPLLPGDTRSERAQIAAAPPPLPTRTFDRAVAEHRILSPAELPGAMADNIRDLFGVGGALLGGAGDYVFRGGRPIELTHTTNINVDGDKLATVIERRLLNNASTYSSGFSTDERPRH